MFEILNQGDQSGIALDVFTVNYPGNPYGLVMGCEIFYVIEIEFDTEVFVFKIIAGLVGVLRRPSVAKFQTAVILCTNIFQCEIKIRPLKGNIATGIKGSIRAESKVEHPFFSA